jgi:hypothetical protein
MDAQERPTERNQVLMMAIFTAYSQKTILFERALFHAIIDAQDIPGANSNVGGLIARK